MTLQTATQEKTLPLLAAAGILLSGAATGHVLLGAVAAAVVLAGLLIRVRPGLRVLGNTLFLLGAIGYAIALLASTGYGLGKDMALRDSVSVDHGTGAGPDEAAPGLLVQASWFLSSLHPPKVLATGQAAIGANAAWHFIQAIVARRLGLLRARAPG